MLDGVLFFPVTPFTAAGEVDLDKLAEHIGKGVDAGPGGVFVACGTGEFHALETEEFTRVVRTAVEVVAGRVPVYAGAGRIGRPGQDLRAGRRGGRRRRPAAAAAVPGDHAAGGSDRLHPEPSPRPPTLPVIVYNRSNARYTEASAVEVAQIPNVVGFKDGTGDVDLVARIVRAVTDALAPTGKPFQFFNGLPTAEVSQQAYRAIGVAAVLVGHLRVRTRTRAGVLQRARA